MVYLRLLLFVIPLMLVVAGTYVRHTRTRPDSQRSLTGLLVQAVAAAAIGGMVCAGIGLQLYCWYSESNLCGIGGLFLGGLAGLYLGGILACVRWYRAAGSA